MGRAQEGVWVAGHHSSLPRTGSAAHRARSGTSPGPVPLRRPRGATGRSRQWLSAVPAAGYGQRVIASRQCVRVCTPWPEKSSGLVRDVTPSGARWHRLGEKSTNGRRCGAVAHHFVNRSLDRARPPHATLCIQRRGVSTAVRVPPLDLDRDAGKPTPSRREDHNRTVATLSLLHRVVVPLDRRHVSGG